jgi:hypothetical protein
LFGGRCPNARPTNRVRFAAFNEVALMSAIVHGRGRRAGYVVGGLVPALRHTRARPTSARLARQAPTEFVAFRSRCRWPCSPAGLLRASTPWRGRPLPDTERVLTFRLSGSFPRIETMPVIQRIDRTLEELRLCRAENAGTSFAIPVLRQRDR